MKRLHYVVVCACVLLLIGTCVPAYAADPGSSCANAIPMGTSYSERVENGQSVWYSAWTFDLPLSVYFAPDNGESDPAPDVEMDFTCRPGYYADSILCSLFCKTSSSGGVKFDMPHTPKLETDHLEDGTFVYYLSLGKTYRDLLLQMGISYNLEVYVHVTYKCSGKISLSQDNLFANCMDNATFMHLGDTVHVAAADAQRHVVVPYVQWQNDTIRYKWTGTTPCIVAVANKCKFDPSVAPDDDILDYQTIMPGDSMTVSAALLSEYVNNQKDYPNDAGMYFVKFYSAEPGVMQIVKAPQTPPRKKATILRFDRTYALNANDTAAFAIPDSWNDDTLNTKFATPTEHLFSMTIATHPDFTAEHTLKTYQFEKAETGHWQGIFAPEMVGFWKKTTEPYLYARFDCSEATTVTPSKWIASGCIENTKNFIQSLDTIFKVNRASTGGFYKFNYSQWLGGDLTLTMNPAVKCDIYVATDCNITQSKTVEEAPNLLYYHQLTSSKNSVTITEEEIAAWGERVTSDGYIYMRYHYTNSGTFKMTIHSDAPVETDPTYPTTTIAVACDDANRPFMEVSKTQTIVIRNESGAEVRTIKDAQPDTKYSLADLPAGKYTLTGESDEIIVNL